MPAGSRSQLFLLSDLSEVRKREGRFFSGTVWSVAYQDREKKTFLGNPWDTFFFFKTRNRSANFKQRLTLQTLLTLPPHRNVRCGVVVYLRAATLPALSPILPASPCPTERGGCCPEGSSGLAGDQLALSPAPGGAGSPSSLRHTQPAPREDGLSQAQHRTGLVIDFILMFAVISIPRGYVQPHEY